MYLRHTTIKKDGKVHRYWRLVESVRLGKRVIQRTVVQLGELTKIEAKRAQAFALKAVGQPEQKELFKELFDDGCRDVAVPVKLKGVKVERSRRFGDVYLALVLWWALKFDDFWDGKIERERAGVTWGKVIATLVCARLCEPSSELHIAEDWFRRTARPDLLQVSEEEMNKDRLYRALDLMIRHQREDRVDAHILVCFLAFAMWKTLENWQSASGLGNSPRTILEEMARIQSHDVLLPTTMGENIRLRCIAQPDNAQSAILARLGITLPKRILISNPPEEMVLPS